MASWYDKAVFYHIYPLGMLGAPFVNTEDAAADRFPELRNFRPHSSGHCNIGRGYIGS